MACTLDKPPKTSESSILYLKGLTHIVIVKKFKGAIDEDCKRLQDISGLTWLTTYKFVKTCERENVFFYSFPPKTNTTFSKKKQSTLLPHVAIDEMYLPREQLHNCTHQDHYELEAFFQSKQSLLDLYASEIASATEASKIQCSPITFAC